MVSVASTSTSTALALFLSLNLLFFTMISSTNVHSSPKPEASKHHPVTHTCPRDVLKFGVCATLLNYLMHIVVGDPPKKPCCPLIRGLADFEAAVCVCTAIKANVMGVPMDFNISMTMLMNCCGKKIPTEYQCA